MGLASVLNGQDHVEALRYSMFSPTGTARYQGMGGALGAVGGDFTSVSINPAGLGLYRSSEFTLTPSFVTTRTESNFLGNLNRAIDYDFHFGSIGYVKAASGARSGGPVSVNFGFGYNTLANFSSFVSMKGINENSSFLDDLTLYANQNPLNLNPFYEQLGFNSYLVPQDPVSGVFWNDVAADGYGEQQIRQVESSGYIGEYSFSTALNFNDFIYVGATLGLQSVRFYEDITHYESDLDDHILNFQGLRFRESNSTVGSGVNFKIGAIVRPIPALRLGASIHLPTFYSLTEQKETDLSSYWDAGSGINDTTAYSPYGEEYYHLTTPFRFTGSAALLVGTIGLLSVDYEYVDYSTAFLRSSNYLYTDENDAVANDYRPVHNLKIGAEVRLQPVYLRAGIQTYMSPYTDERNDGAVLAPSCGIGFRNKKYSLDMSYQYKVRNEVYGLYSIAEGVPEVALNSYRTGNVLVTFGVRF